jgi:hypothetical protein
MSPPLFPVPHAPARHGAKSSIAPFLVAVASVVLAGVFLFGLQNLGF